MEKRTYSSFLLKLFKSFDVTTEMMWGLHPLFHEEMKRGLTDKGGSLKMLPAFVDRPTGKEKGTFIALDLGGTNFRVLKVRLDGNGNARVENVERFVIPSVVMHGTGTQMFNFIAKSIQKFVVNNKVDTTKTKKLGFTFSFPMKQLDIENGILVTWTKDFSASGVVGKNVVSMLSDSLRQFGLEVLHINALANDTVGTFAAGAYKDPKCDVGIIFGTGTNACYREKIVNIKKLARGYHKKDHMIINIEWGNFDKLPLNEYDLKLDKSTKNPRKQRMEKMISGMYLGELARLVLSDLIRRKFIFVNSKAKFTKGALKTTNMSLIESDRSKDLIKIKGFLEHAGILKTTVSDRNLLKEICMMISSRAARVSAAAISSVITWMDPKLSKHHTVAIDGTLYERYPGFSKRITGALKELHGGRAKRIKLTKAKDGSGTGVAIIAAVAAKKKNSP